MFVRYAQLRLLEALHIARLCVWQSHVARRVGVFVGTSYVARRSSCGYNSIIINEFVCIVGGWKHWHGNANGENVASAFLLLCACAVGSRIFQLVAHV